jgi:hypothetical protein
VPVCLKLKDKSPLYSIFCVLTWAQNVLRPRPENVVRHGAKFAHAGVVGHWPIFSFRFVIRVLKLQPVNLADTMIVPNFTNLTV